MHVSFLNCAFLLFLRTAEKVNISTETERSVGYELGNYKKQSILVVLQSYVTLPRLHHHNMTMGSHQFTEEPPEVDQLKKCKEIVSVCFDYGIISFVVIIILASSLCIVAFVKPRQFPSPVSFVIQKARFHMNTNDENGIFEEGSGRLDKTETGDRQNQTNETGDRQNLTNDRQTEFRSRIPPLPEIFHNFPRNHT